MGEHQVRRQMDRDAYIRGAEINQGPYGIWRSAGCGCRIMRGNCEYCPDCVDMKIQMTGYDSIDRPHPVIGRTGMIRYVVPIEACGRKIDLGFCTKEDFEGMGSTIDRLFDRCFELKPREEHWVVARWTIFGGPVKVSATGDARLLPLKNASEIALKMPRLSLSPGQVRRRLHRLRSEIDAVRDAMSRGILLPEGKAALDELDLRLWESFIRARVAALLPGGKF